MQKDQALKKKISKKIGKIIEFYRDKNNLTQEELAYNVGVDRTYISALENGTRCASVYSLYLIAKKLKINLKDLVDINII